MDSLHQSYSGSLDGFSGLLFFYVVAALLLIILGTFLLPAFIVAAVGRRRAEYVRNRRQAAVIAQYEPPLGLSPAEMGLLYDMQCGQNEIVATIFSLEHRGVIAIVKQGNVNVINKAAYEALEEYEKIAIRIWKGDTEELDAPQQVPVIYLNPINGEKHTYDLILPSKKSRAAFAAAVRASVERKGIKMNNFASAFMLRAVIIAALLGYLLLLTAAFPGTSNGAPYSAWSWTAISSAAIFTLIFDIILSPVYLAAGFLAVYAWIKIAGRYWMNTKQARAVWPELEGYCLYLKQVELDDIQFQTSSGHLDSVAAVMPYAMIFGLDTKWRELLIK